MDYKKKYEEAIERLKQWDKEHPNGYVISDRDEFIFPELKEIEGEKVRKWLINLLSTMQFHHCDDDAGMPNKALSWIEKQGEQKAVDTDNKFIRMRETKPKDISEFLDRLTTVEQEFLWEHIAKIRELDKEEQKSAWSEEDEKDFNTAIQHIENYVNNTPSSQRPEIWADITKLKSLRPQSSWKPSDEQMRALEAVIGCVGNNLSEEFSVKWLWELFNLKEQLKKLREE